MHREGHLGAGLLAYAPVAFVTAAFGFRQLTLYGVVAVAILCTLPDVDIRIPLVSHRGPTHTIWFALIIGVLGGVFGGVIGASAGVSDPVGLAVFGFVVGTLTILSHIAADALTPMGVRPFAPYRRRHYTFDVVKASNPIANYALLFIGVVAVGIAYTVGTTVVSSVG